MKSSDAGPVILWFRRDLRLADNPALWAACETGSPIIPLYILDEETPGVRPLGGAGRWWLHHSLTALADAIGARGQTGSRSALVLRRGSADEVLLRIVAETGARGVYWNRSYEPGVVARDTRIKAALTGAGIAAESSQATLLFEPWTVTSGSGTPFRVFTPFWKACLQRPEPAAPAAAPPSPGFAPPPDGAMLADWALLPDGPAWAGGLRETWSPGEAGAHDRLAGFLDGALADYAQGRDMPGKPLVSMLSPHLRFGEIGPRQIWHAVRQWAAAHGQEGAAAAYLRELGWREFCHGLLYHNPHMQSAPFRPEFSAFPWRDDPAALAAWQQGETGYPLVDAGMRELWHTGWMHNRVRMVAASFLVKHLLISWRAGERWFWDTLVDADLANNVANWQWVAGCGADAAPYFRIFNPVLQGQKFDPDGAYVRRWIPALAELPAKHLHAPWTAPPDVLTQAGVRLGDNYPRPIVDHGAARKRALAAFKGLKDAGGRG